METKLRLLFLRTLQLIQHTIANEEKKCLEKYIIAIVIFAGIPGNRQQHHYNIEVSHSSCPPSCRRGRN